MVRLTTWRRKIVYIINTKWPPYATIIPNSATSYTSRTEPQPTGTCLYLHTFPHLHPLEENLATCRWEYVCIMNTKWPPYASIVPRHTAAGRSLNLQARFRKPSSHTFILWLNSHHLTSIKGPNSHQHILHISGADWTLPLTTNVLYQKKKNFISTAGSTSTLANPTLTLRNISRSTHQLRTPSFQSQGSPCLTFVSRPAIVITFFSKCLGFHLTFYR